MELKLPELGENISQGTVTKVLVRTGEAVKKGQNILELETDKAVLEVPSDADGVVSEALVKNGDVVKVGQVVFKLSGAVRPAAAPAKSVPVPAAAAPSVPAPAAVAVAQTIRHVPARANVPAAPSARLFARELGLDIGQIPGTGPGGRISLDDIKAYAKGIITGTGAGRGAQPSLPNFGKWGNVRRSAMNNVRKKTAEHLSSAWNIIPHVTQFEKADITELEKLRKERSNPRRKLSITPFVIKAAALGLKKFPQFNASVDMASSEIIYKDYINIGVAVDTDRGLIVPVLKNVNKMSVDQISDELTAMAERACGRKTTIEEMQGGCFSISNLGGIGGTFFAPIVNWPEVAILGVSRGALEPVYADGQFIPKLMLPLSLSYDHRLIDGVNGARFIRFIAETLQNPGAL